MFTLERYMMSSQINKEVHVYSQYIILYNRLNCTDFELMM